MKSTRSRIGVVAMGLVVGFCAVMLHLWILMVHQHDAWARRSRENRWAFRSVPSQRGSLLDRRGRLLACDEPTTELAIYYERFRVYHPVGAAVHGATLWASLQPGAEGSRYGYLDGALGPQAAVEHLLAMPARTLRPGVLAKDLAGELGSAVTTVMSACSGQSRRRVFGELRRASERRGDVPIGDLLTAPRAVLLANFADNVASLRRFADQLRDARRDRLEQAGQGDVPASTLIEVLDELRRASLEKRLTPRGTPVETIRRVFDDRVPFDLAAGLRIGAEQHPGLEIAPSIARMPTVAPGTALRALLGAVSDLDRHQPDREWVKRYIDRELPDEWLADLVPSGVVDTDEAREVLQAEARQRYERAMLLEERRGTSGIEAAFNDTLMGRLGLRLVERDAKRREKLLWSHLRVESGDDVRVTFDRDVQELAEQVVVSAHRRTTAMFADEQDREKVAAALAVIDARSGDVLAFAGAPLRGPAPRQVPGVTWTGVGYLGSVVKPFVLVEQLDAMAKGRAHLPLERVEACSGSFHYGGTTIRCGHAHWDAGRDPVEAIAESCNLFFYQCTVGLGEDGFARALRRFGLMPPAGEGDPSFARWQPSVRGLPIEKPSVDGPQQTLLPRRGIGYGVQASPLSVARAYAGIATGALPTLGVRFGETRASTSLADLDGELTVVREGLQRCVEAGTAKRIDTLRRLQVRGKTGTAEVGTQQQNNAWFAGYLPSPSREGVQLCCCAVVYWVPDSVHGGEAAGQIVAEFLEAMQASAELDAHYVRPESGR